MSWFYRHFIRPALFRKDAEKAHTLMLEKLGLASRNHLTRTVLGVCFGAPELPTKVFNLEFPNPVGVAAGLDKHGEAVPVWEKLGFGFCEIGCVTWHAQPGNPPPRIFRAIEDQGIINRLGFNNSGAEVLAQRLTEWKKSGRWPHHPVGINLGKSKVTPLELAPEEYAKCFKTLRNLADFFVVNVSSPNTPGLRQLQDKFSLDGILMTLQEAQESSEGKQPHKPILIKVAPDLSFEALDEILELVEPRKIAGIVATNTTINRPAAISPAMASIYAETGGMSGRPLRARSTEVVRHLYRQSGGKLPIIGVGGIFNANDAWEKITAGACLIQIYSGLVYEGPSLTASLVKGLRTKLKTHGFRNLRQAVGSAN